MERTRKIRSDNGERTNWKTHWKTKTIIGLYRMYKVASFARICVSLIRPFKSSE